MTPETENALRAIARKCRSEILKARESRPKSEYDHISTTLLDKYAKTINFLPPDTFPAKRWLSYYVRQVDKEISK
jgi:hypothetical protein